MSFSVVGIQWFAHISLFQTWDGWFNRLQLTNYQTEIKWSPLEKFCGIRLFLQPYETKKKEEAEEEEEK